MEMGQNHIDLIRQSKNNVITGSNKQNGSVGKYYSFSNKGGYTMIDDISVGKYAIKKNENPLKQKKTILTVITME